MKNFHFYSFLWTVGVFFVYGQNDSSGNNKTNSEIDLTPAEKQVEKHNEQSVSTAPDESLLVHENSFRTRQGFLEDRDRIPPVRIPVGGKRQNIYLTGDSERYNVHLENSRHERPTYFQAALGALSAHIINQKNEKYIPYPPNGDPFYYPGYRGHPRATEPPVIGAYERSSSSKIDAPPLLDFSQQNSRRVFADINNIYQRSSPELGNSGPGFYPDQVRDLEKINKWYEHQRNEYTMGERIF